MNDRPFSDKSADIIVVDNVLDNINLFREILTLEGYSFRYASNCKEAIEEVNASKPDLILIDLKILINENYEVCQILQSGQETNAIPIIAIKDSEDSNKLAKAFEVGVSDFINKPIIKQELLVRLKAHLELYHSRITIQKHQNELENIVAERTLKLQKSQEIIDTSTETIITTNLDGIIVDWNNAAHQLYGYTAKEVLGKPMSLLYRAEEKPKLNALISALSKGEAVRNAEFGCVDKNNNEKTVLLSLTSLKDPNGNITELVAFSRDITEIKGIQNELSSLNLLFEDTSKTAKVGGWVVDIENNSEAFTNQTFDIYELPRGELPSIEEGINFYHPDYRKIVTDAVNNAIENNVPYNIEVKLITAKNNEIWVQTKGNPITKNGKVVKLYGSIQDITERKQFEEDNTNLALKMKEASKLAKLGWWELEAETNSLTWSDNLFEIFGYDPNLPNPDFEEVMKKNVHPEDSPRLYEKINIALTNGTPYDIKLRIIRSDGTTGYMEARAEPLKDENGKVIKLIGTSLDISDRISTQLALEESEKRFQNMASNLVGAIFQYVLKPDGTNAVNYMSPSCFDLWEVDAETVVKDGQVLWDMVHPDDREPMFESVQNSAKHLEPWFFQWRIITPSGKRKWLEAAGRPEKRENGDIIWDSLILDVTERRLAELKLEESEERFEAFMENTPASIFIKNRNLKHVYGNRRLLDLIGKSKKDYIGTTAHDFFDNKTATALDEADETVLKTKSKVEIEFPFKVNGKEIWLRDIKFPIELPNGERYVGGLAFDITDKRKAELDLKNALDQVTELKNKYEKENIYLKEEIDLAFNYQNFVYTSNEISEVLNQVDMVASTNATVLLMGETGTGKEIIARAIHSNSLKSNNPLIKVNCAAIPNELIESELFGHKKGSFTGAINNRIGKFELADGGTLFLDEIGELPIEMQPKLLRVLQEGEIEPIGGSKTVKVDVRIIAATNRNLLEEVEKGNFREDLFFRLNVFPINIPPLRERRDDIPVLINHFVSKFSARYRKELKLILKEDLEALMSYNWPGNVRELENFIERSVIVSQGDHISFNLGSNEDKNEKRDLKSIGKTLDDIQREHIIRTLNKTNWKIAGNDGASAILDIKPSTLRDRMKKLNIQKP